MTSLDLLVSNILSPPVLAFTVGIIAVYAKSDLKFPDQIYQGITIYLLLAIGFKGGSSLAKTELSEVILPIISGIGIASLIPVAAFFLARLFLKFKPRDCAALAAHYGSVSAVTFMASLAFLQNNNVTYESYVTALMALMEVPAIVVALVMAQVFGSNRKIKWGETLLEVLSGKSVVLLIFGLFIGFASGEDGYTRMKPFLIDPFYGVLTLFLLEMGLIAGEKLKDVKKVGLKLVIYAIVLPLIQGFMGAFLGTMIGLSEGGVTVFAVLSASASYIAAPAAIRVSLPDANPAYYVTASLAITFPFNLTLGIPLYASWASWMQQLNGI
ncbi:MAG: sodium-dependent bicarbonate transport family permease [Verrucomicrobiota bacterium]